MTTYHRITEVGPDASTAAATVASTGISPPVSPTSGVPNTDHASVIRRGMWVLAIGFGGFMLWAGLAPLDEGVPSPGVLSVETKRKKIDHLNGGIVEHLAVRDGQRVEAGDPLLTLNETQSKAALNARLSQWRVASATVARLQAERDDKSTVTFPADLLKDADPKVQEALRTQKDLFASRRRTLEGELRILRESARGMQAQMDSLTQLKTGREKQVALFNEQLDNFRSLGQQGYVSRNQILETERQLADVQSKQGEDLSNIGATQTRLAEVRMREQQKLLEYRQDVGTQLAEAMRDQALKAEELNATKDSHERLVIRSPVDGVVVDLAVTTVGGVVKPGDRLMDIVPDSEDLVVQAQLSPQFIDRVHQGLATDVHFDSYVSMLRRPVLPGKLEWVSADVMHDERTGAPYFRMQVRIAGDELAKQKNLKLFAGMQCTVMVKTGERSMLNYLLRPLLQRLSASMTEV